MVELVDERSVINGAYPVLFSKVLAFLCSILKPSTENIKKCSDKTVLKMWSQIFEKKS